MSSPLIDMLKHPKQTVRGVQLWWKDLPGRWGRGPSIPWGLHIIDGPQGCGKTLWMSMMLHELKANYGPRVQIAANYEHSDGELYIDDPDEFIQIIRRRVTDIDLRARWHAVHHGDGEEWQAMRREAEEQGDCPRVPHLAMGVSEVHTWFNSRKWQSLDQRVFEIISQQRKLRLLLVADLQDWGEVDVSWRRKAKFCWAPRLHMATRLMIVHQFGARPYARYMEASNGWGDPKQLRNLKVYETVVRPIEDEDRERYNTYRIAETMMIRAEEKASPIKASLRRKSTEKAESRSKVLNEVMG